ncbi:unnamed protein product [Dicrocoelium dendriticum]|nr:unnamed protein product [Dicrocoelium dendriticum]
MISVNTASARSCYVCNSSESSHCLAKIDLQTTPLRPSICNVADAKFCIKTTGIYGIHVTNPARNSGAGNGGSDWLTRVWLEWFAFEPSEPLSTL